MWHTHYELQTEVQLCCRCRLHNSAEWQGWVNSLTEWQQRRKVPMMQLIYGRQIIEWVSYWLCKMSQVLSTRLYRSYQIIRLIWQASSQGHQRCPQGRKLWISTLTLLVILRWTMLQLQCGDFKNKLMDWPKLAQQKFLGSPYILQTLIILVRESFQKETGYKTLTTQDFVILNIEREEMRLTKFQWTIRLRNL